MLNMMRAGGRRVIPLLFLGTLAMAIPPARTWGQEDATGVSSLRSKEVSAAVPAKTTKAALQGPAAPPPPPPPPPRTPPFAQPNIQPTLLDWLTARPIAEKIKIRKTDPLLRPPFSDIPLDSVKGVAAKIRAEELDTCNRVRAVKYLGTVDCVAFPEAQDKLIDAMHNDKFAIVRYEAAMALGHMLCNSGDKDAKRILCSNKIGGDKCCRKIIKKHDKNKHYVSGLSACEGCCNEKVIKALEKTAYEQDEYCCWFEPSYKVRQAAIRALQCCEDWCPRMTPETNVPPILEDNEIQQERREEDLPPDPQREPDPTTGPVSQVSASSTRFRPHPTPIHAPEHLPELKALNGYCIVAMKDKKFLRTDPTQWSVHEGRIYYFSSPEAKESFDDKPNTFAVKWAGMDAIEYCKSGEFVEGQYLHLNANGNLYLFATRENRAEFQEKADVYITASRKIAMGEAAPGEFLNAEPDNLDVETIDSLSEVPSSASTESEEAPKKGPLSFLRRR